jgi:nucleotide-binding universal stress UspA family protein
MELARGWGAAVHVVTAYASGSSGMGAASGAALADTGAREGIAHEAAGQIGEKAVAAWGQGLATTLHAVGGHPADAIVETATKVNADLIVVGSKGMHGARRILGSVPNSVAHAADCAVLIVKTD